MTCVKRKRPLLVVDGKPFRCNGVSVSVNRVLGGDVAFFTSPYVRRDAVLIEADMVGGNLVFTVPGIDCITKSLRRSGRVIITVNTA